MSLITDALGLRQRRGGKKIARQEPLPPFRPARPQRAAAIAVAVLLAAGGLVFWRGPQALEWLENLVLDLPGAKKVAEPLRLPAPAPGGGEVSAEKAADRKDGEMPVVKESTPVPGETPPASLVPATTGVATPEPEKKKEEAADGRAESAEAGSISVSLAPTKEEEEKIRRLQEEERVREVREYLRRVQIQGVSEDGEDSRVLMDGQLVGLGEKTPLLDLILDKVEPGQILFRDVDGKQYPKSY